MRHTELLQEYITVGQYEVQAPVAQIAIGLIFEAISYTKGAGEPAADCDRL